MRDRRDMIRLHLQRGVTDLKDIRESYNIYADGGDNEKNKYNNTQVADAISNNVPNNVNDRISPIEMTREQYFRHLQSIQPNGTITPETSEQKYKRDIARLREYLTSDLYANQRINDAKNGLSAITAATSFIPGPVGVASRFVNVALDADQFIQNKDT